jgi:hypothetical protein
VGLAPERNAVSRSKLRRSGGYSTPKWFIKTIHFRKFFYSPNLVIAMQL